ncbi:hypothetical protein OAK02_02755 [Candidatus Nitrosopelagicus sp.]|nr:hypothetical protein [Candidatus Nitrosopelagicus sp.]
MSRVGILVASLAVIMLASTVGPAFAAQMEFRTWVEGGASDEVEIKFQRTVILNYDDGGMLADELRGQKFAKTFSVDSNDPGVNELRDRINYQFSQSGSSAAVTDVQIDYDTKLTGRGLNTSIDYKIILTMTLTNHVLRESSGNNSGLVDMNWRGLMIPGEVTVNAKGIPHEINLPISFISDVAPGLYSAILGSEAETLLNTPIMDASGIKAQPLGNWHFLFDPTGINVDAAQYGMSSELAGVVWSSYTMGESSLREGIQTEKEHEATFTTDTTYDLRTIESADSANIFFAGFANIDVLDSAEVVGVYPEAPEGFATTSTGEFPVMIIYGMAGFAGLAGVAIFIVSEKKRKGDIAAGNVQTGIDPSQLVGADTSTGSGGYKTNRGEAHLKSDDYEHHRSVYDNPQVEQKAEEPTTEQAPAEEPTTEDPASKPGAMPKGWKPE